MISRRPFLANLATVDANSHAIFPVSLSMPETVIFSLIDMFLKETAMKPVRLVKGEYPWYPPRAVTPTSNGLVLFSISNLLMFNDNCPRATLLHHEPVDKKQRSCRYCYQQPDDNVTMNHVEARRNVSGRFATSFLSGCTLLSIIIRLQMTCCMSVAFRVAESEHHQNVLNHGILGT